MAEPLSERCNDRRDKVTKSTGKAAKRDAERVAAKWESAVNQGREHEEVPLHAAGKFGRLDDDEVLTGLPDPDRVEEGTQTS